MTYCYSLTDAQLEQVLLKEYDRHEAGGDSELYYEAREECVRRDINPDTVIIQPYYDLLSRMIYNIRG